MSEDKQNCEKSWISLVLRISIASLFLSAAIGKFQGGLDGVVGYFQGIFKDTWLPGPLVTLQARITPFVEALIPIWLISGFKLKTGWIVTALFTVSLAFGMVVAKQYDSAAHNYFYVLLCCVGLYFSPYDRFGVDGMKK